MDDRDLALLEDGKTSVAAIPDLIAAVSDGARVAIRIDLTDPPSLVVASIRGIEAVAETADAAVQALAPIVAERVRFEHAKAEAEERERATEDEEKLEADAEIDR